MEPRLDADNIRALGEVAERGHLHQGSRPVHWCMDCRSALAVAEVEYRDRTSPAIDVLFAAVDGGELARRLQLEVAADDLVGVAIWTTTPWTLPANQAVALHADLAYTALGLERDGQRQWVVVAEARRDAVADRLGVEPVARGRATGAELEGLALQDRKS